MTELYAREARLMELCTAAEESGDLSAYQVHYTELLVVRDELEASGDWF